jgi:hypothetical protein
MHECLPDLLIREYHSLPRWENVLRAETIYQTARRVRLIECQISPAVDEQHLQWSPVTIGVSVGPLWLALTDVRHECLGPLRKLEDKQVKLLLMESMLHSPVAFSQASGWAVGTLD